MNKSKLLSDVSERVLRSIDKIKKMPWRDQSFYRNWIAEMYFQIDKSSVSEDFCGRESFAALDARYFDIEIENYRSQLGNYFVFDAFIKGEQTSKPAAIGSAIALLSLSIKTYPWIADVVCSQLSIKTTPSMQNTVPVSFLRTCAEIDKKLLEGAVAALEESIEPDKYSQILEAAHKSLFNYENFLDQMLISYAQPADFASDEGVDR